jgi:LysM repeat protein
MTRAATKVTGVRRRVGGPLAIVSVCLALLASCGSGGGGGAERTTTTAPTTTVAPTTTTATAQNYQVQRGDTLTSIARKFHVTVAVLLTVNKLADPDHLSEGQTLVIPPVPPVSLTVTPPNGLGGTSFDFKVVGAKPAEQVTFQIDYPGGKFTGPPHVASNEGDVEATYVPSLGAAPGAYAVTALGSQGTTVKGTFRVDNPALPSTTVAGQPPPGQ